MKTLLGWKVPFRHNYATTFRVWLAACIHCHIVLRLNPPPDLKMP